MSKRARDISQHSEQSAETLDSHLAESLLSFIISFKIKPCRVIAIIYYFILESHLAESLPLFIIISLYCYIITIITVIVVIIIIL